MIRVCVAGVSGWTGSEVAKAVLASPEFELVGAVARRAAVRAESAATCNTILARPGWAERVRAAHRSADAGDEHRAWRLAPLVGVDLWDEAVARLAGEPVSAYRYQELMRTDDPARLARVVTFAEAHLPLAAIAAGPADELGLGPAFAAHGCLDTLLQEMKRDGVYSAALVAAGLRSPVVRNRNMAVNALDGRPVGEWGEGVAGVVERAVADEPRDDVRERLAALAARVGGG